MQWCFNEHKDVPRDIRDFLENASGQPLEQLSIEDINSFLTGYDAFCNHETVSYTHLTLPTKA